MTQILHRQIGRTLPVAAAGEGVYIIDDTGKRYIDASGGAAVSCLGHGHPDVLAAMHAQIDTLAYAHTSFFTTAVAEELADTLIADAPAGLSHVYFVSGGSEAIEAALKMARQYFVESGEPQRAPLHRAPPELSRQHARRARGRRQRMAPRAVRAAADRRRPRRRRATSTATGAPARTPEDYGERLGAGARSDDRARSAPNSVIAFVAETVGRRHRGRADAGRRLLQARARGLRPARRAADPRRGDVRHGPHRHAARLRAGRRRARPDGDRQGPRRRLPADRRGARVRRRIVDALRAAAAASSSTATPTSATRSPAPRRWPCSRSSSATGCSQRAHARARSLTRRLRERFGDHPHVGDIRGRGLFSAIELVADRATKAAVRSGAASCTRAEARGDGSAA